MTEHFSGEEKCLLSMLREEMTGQEDSERQKLLPKTAEEWKKLEALAARHSVLPLIWHPLAEEASAPIIVRRQAETTARRTVVQSYHILFLCRYLIKKLEEEGIHVVLLKGVGTASFYPVPELRKTGDVDLLLPDVKQLERACEVLKKSGCTVKERQLALHHVVFASEEGITVEIHTMFVEPFDNAKINNYLKKKLPDCESHVVRMDVMGVELPLLSPGFHAWQLLLHMLQDFLRAGFGLKLFCDWVAFWNHDVAEEEKRLYLELAEESGLKGFSDIVSETCLRYLGLRREKVEFMGILMETDMSEIFLRDVLESGDFGKASNERMVLMRNAGLGGYAREFHHQSCLNFPKASRCFVCWPVLWVMTLGRFLHNNRSLRRVSTKAVLKKAAQRSRLMERLKLWK